MTTKQAPLSGHEAAALFRLLALARRRGLPLLPAATGLAGLTGLPQIGRLAPRLTAVGEAGLLDALEAAVAAGVDAPGASMLALARRADLSELALTRLAGWFQRRGRARAQLLRAMVYPLTLTVTTLLVASFLVQAAFGPTVVEGFRALYGQLGASLPVPTRIAFAIYGLQARLLQSPLTALLYAGAVLVVAALLLRLGARIHELRLALRIPILSRHVTLQATRGFCESLSVLLASAVPLPEAVELSARGVGNEGLRDELMRLVAKVTAGESLGEAFRECPALSGSARWRLWNAYFRSDLPAELPRVAAAATIELDAQERRLASAANAFAWGLAFVALSPLSLLIVSMYLPLFSLISHIG